MRRQCLAEGVPLLLDLFNGGKLGASTVQNSVGLNRDLLLRGDDTTLCALTIDLRQDGDGFQSEVALAMTH